MLRENTKATLFALLPLSKISIIHFPYKSPVLSPSISMPNLTNFVKIPLPHAFISLTLCFVGGIIRRMENNGWKMVWKIVFSTVWEAKEKREDGKLGRKFSSLAHQFFSSQIGRKTMERKLLLPWNYTNAFSHLPSSLTQWLFWNQVKNKKKKKMLTISSIKH